MKCPICEKGNLEKKKTEEYMNGVYLGKFDAEVCNKCNESFTDSKTTKLIEESAKKKNVWGLGTKTKLIKSGNSLAIRIPKKIIDFLELKEGSKSLYAP
jgi:YgiT-type zinc finger domain-containing protein